MVSSFDELFKKALSEWPEELVFSELVFNKDDNRLYYPRGLGLMTDEIEEPYIGAYDEVIMRNLHDAIGGVLHAVSLNMVRIQTSQIRSSSVKERFERKLRECFGNRDLYYTESDDALVLEYFAIEEQLKINAKPNTNEIEPPS